MKNLLNIALTLLASLACSNLYSQEFDESIITKLSTDQIAEAKNVLGVNGEFTNPSKVSPDNFANKEESIIPNKASIESRIEAVKFGYDFISTSPTSITATGDLPLPNDYKIALGDIIGVVLSGSKENIFDMQVQLNGTVFFPEIGSISVVGETFIDIKKKFDNLVDQSFIGVSIDLSLKELSAKKITIVGAVNNPGTYLVNPFTTISNALAYSGGIKEIGSLRNIKLVRTNGDTFSLDLYDLFIDGDRSNDITIESGDVILISAANKFIKIDGMVKRPGLYEILPGNDLSDLLKYAMGVSGRANIKKIILDKLDLQSSSVVKVITDDLSYSLDSVLSVNIFPYIDDNISHIKVEGAIEEPGYYKIDDYKTLEKLINELDFVNVYPWLAVLEQFDKNNLIKSSILFSLNDPNTYKSIKLLPNSKLYFANIYSRSFDVGDMSLDLIQDYELRINHKSKSFNMPVYGYYSVASFIDFLGLDMSDVDELATYISPLENLVINDNYKKMEFYSKKYNTISFRSPVNDLISVTISGAIDYPGTYTLMPNSTIQDLYNMIGEFKPEAFLDGIIFTRETVRERQLQSIQKSRDDLNKTLLINTQKGFDIGNIEAIQALSESIEPKYLGRIAGNFSPNLPASIETILLDGDSIIIPKNPNVINVLGEVLNPIAFEYSDKLTIKSAISNAGGFQDHADKRKVYVIKSNGMIVKASRNIFSNNVNLESGDTIIVPRKLVTNNPGVQALLPITKILSDLAFSAAALQSLSETK